MGIPFGLFKISFDHPHEGGGGTGPREPVVERVGQRGRIFSHNPRGTLIEAHRQVHVQVPEISLVEPGQVVIGHREIDLSHGHHPYQVLHHGGIVIDRVNNNPSPQLVIKVHEPVVVTGTGKDDHLFTDQAGHVGEHRVGLPGTLHQYLM